MSLHVTGRLSLVWVLFFALPYLPLQAQAQVEAKSSVRLFDTGDPLPAPSSDSVLPRKADWTEVPEDDTSHKFRGAAVFANDRLAVALRLAGQGAEVYSKDARGFALRTFLRPIAAGPASLVSFSIVENNRGTVAVEAALKTPDGRPVRVRYQLDMGQAFLKTEARQGARGLQIVAPCRFVVLPDFFADDIVVDARETPVTRALVPSENFLLQMLPGGEAIVMSVTGSRGQDAVIGLSSKDAERKVDYSEIYYGRDGKIWVAVIEGHDVWYRHDVAPDDAGKILPLDWKAPYPAQWRVDWRRDDKLTDSWEMLTQKPSGEYVKHGWLGQPESFGTADWMQPARQRWTTVLGRFQYPCWVDESGRGHFQPLKKVVRFQGPALIYPINRVKATPLSVFTVVDIVRATLGVGPCEYILDVEGQQKEFQGIATCAARDKLNAIYKQKLQKQKRSEVEKALADGLAFVQHIRGRIEDYVAFGHEMLKYLAEQKKAHPELAAALTEMETLTRKIDDYVARRKAGIGTQAQAVKLVEEFRMRLIDYEGDDALGRCQEFGKALTRIGGSQDELVGECRMAVKVLRQRAGLAMGTDPDAAEIAKEIRRRTQEILRNPTSYEAPRH